MKKTLCLAVALLSLFVFTGCRSETAVLTIMTPAGSPALAQLYLQNDAQHYAVDIVDGSDPLLAAFGSGSHDVILAPTNLGARLYATGVDYQFAGTLTWGNYYLVSAGKDLFDLPSLAGQTIIAFGANQTSDVILQYILAENDLAVTLTYLDSAANTAAALKIEPSKIVLVAEPSLSVLKISVSGLQIIDLQDEYQKISGTNSYPQAGIFVKKSLDHQLIQELLADMEASIDNVNADPAAAAALAVSLGFGFPEAALRFAIPGSRLDFVGAAESKTALEAYFCIILGSNPALVGGTLPADDFYFIP